MIRLEQISKVFNQGRPNEFRAIHGLSLGIAADRVTLFTGPSGSGKTTLLSLVGCLARPTSGRIYLKGRMISALPERFLTDIRRSTFGFVFQRFNLIKGLSLIENVMLPAYPLGLPFPELRERAAGLLHGLGLGSKLENRVEWLSGGEAQRAAICRALINDPAILIADEPTANLDSALTREFLAIVEGLRGQGKGVIITSHDPLIAESAVMEAVIRMRDGRRVERMAMED
ncbi:MAG: ABC transporter ATP-binding protein [Gammaproteobacteria bacterium]|nr:ABC transporter ATP-binding protein [Gammaproteobacteria bacterium]MBU1653742.1 ABC transporter ATP-binding protein [Gammaproteobacteria bacterium]MBU1959619.1 ABC transporter ATP-binding protein [Gammaproteobacteria bacterium]